MTINFTANYFADLIKEMEHLVYTFGLIPFYLVLFISIIWKKHGTGLRETGPAGNPAGNDGARAALGRAGAPPRPDGPDLGGGDAGGSRGRSRPPGDHGKRSARRRGELFDIFLRPPSGFFCRSRRSRSRVSLLMLSYCLARQSMRRWCGQA